MSIADGSSGELGRPLASVTVTRAVAIRCLALSVVAFVGAAFLLGAVLELVTGRSLEPVTVGASSPAEVVAGTVLLVGLLVVVVVPHELLHGLFMARYGGRPEYGVALSRFVLPYAYARTEDAVYTRDQMLVILLAPFAGITIAGLVPLLALQSPLFVLPLAANAAGSTGDLWLAARLVRYPPSVRVAAPADDVSGGIGIYGSSADRPSDPSPLSSGLSTVFYGAAGTFALTVAALVAAVIASLAFGSGDVSVGRGSWLLFRHELEPDGYGASVELGFAALSAVSIVGGLAWALVAEVRSES